MFLIFFIQRSKSIVQYSWISNSLTISGDGAVTRSGVLSDGDYTTLQEVVIKEGITEIGEIAFQGCNSLISVAIPASVTKIDQSTFTRCKSLKIINVSTDNKNYMSDGQYAL